MRLTSLINVRPETVSQSKPRNRNCCAGTSHDFVVDDKTHSGEKAERCRQMRETLFPGGTQNEDILQVEDRSNSLRVEEGLQRLRHHRENEQSQAEAERKNHVLVKALPTKAKEASMDVEIRILEID